ncbi:MAG: alpha-glycosidase [Oscillospiraceae bacterium]|nr:alpha-glycosidase [Oscillospiraceae bacterium]
MINRHAVFHEAKSRHAFAADVDTLHIRLRTARGDVQSVVVYAIDPFNWFPDKNGSDYSFDKESLLKVEMKQELSDELFDYWFCELRNTPTNRLRYCFVLKKDSEILRFGSSGFTDEIEPDFSNLLGWFNFPFINEEDVFNPPDWVEDTVWYQIFCDRFARSGNNSSSRTENSGSGKTIPGWGSQTDNLHRISFGGNLKGVIDKLPYIAEMGFTGIYFTPIFQAPSTHKYDTTDYFKIDPQFGTNEIFSTLVRRAHELGIRVILDAVFNHCGFTHPFFQDVIKNGSNSPYYSYFHILKQPVLNFKLNSAKMPPRLTKEEMQNLSFRTFAYTPHMPKWNTADPGAREYLINAARYWVEEYDIDGWRMDVSNEVSHDFWRELCKAVRGIKSDIFMLGENWDDAYPWLCSGQFDSTMNYPLLSAIGSFAGGRSNAAEFASTMTREVLAAYPKPIQKLLFNMVDNHDTDRLMTGCGGNTKAAILGFVLLFTMCGCPSVYYGSEVGMDGTLHGDANRRCMLWDKPVPPDRDFRPLIKKLITLRKKHPAFRTTEIVFNNCNDALLTFTKKTDDETLVVILNNSAAEQRISLPPGTYTNLMDDSITTGNSFALPPYEFKLLLQDSSHRHCAH